MKFYRLENVPVSVDDQVFKRSPAGAGISLAVISSITLACLALGFFRVNGITVPPFIFFILAGTAALFGLLAWHSFRASLRSSNWLLRCQRSGVVIHFRSFLNWKVPGDGFQAVGFDYTEIAWAKIVKEKRRSPSLGGEANDQVQWQTFLQLGLRDPDTTTLEGRLRPELNLKSNGVMITHDYPVQVLPGGIIELNWRRGIKPSIAAAVECLRPHIKITEPDSRQVDLTHKPGALPAEEDGKILELAQRGDELAAIQLAREVYRYSLREAREHVEDLKSGKRKPTSK